MSASQIDTSKRIPLAKRLPKAPPRPHTGRPGRYTPQLAADVIDRLCAGQTVTQIAKTEGMPAWVTIRKWLLNYPEFATEYARAREISADVLEAEAIDRLRNAKTQEQSAAARAFLDGVKWSTSKRAPKVYGERMQVDGNIDVTVGLADRLDAARKRLAQAAAGKLIEGTVVAADLPKPDGEC